MVFKSHFYLNYFELINKVLKMLRLEHLEELERHLNLVYVLLVFILKYLDDNNICNEKVIMSTFENFWHLFLKNKK